jgi:hypothetical protein
VLLPTPTTPYDIPLWSEPKVARDQLAAVAKAFYSIPHRYVGHTLTARADSQIVCFYAGNLLVKTHPRKGPGQQSIDPNDYPVERSVYALRNVAALRRQAEDAGVTIGRYAAALLDCPLPWTRMRRVYALLGLVRRYGAARVEAACARAHAVGEYRYHTVKTILVHALDRQPLPGLLAEPAPAAMPAPRQARPWTTFFPDPGAEDRRSVSWN